MMDVFEPFDFTLDDIENIGFHYAWTLERRLQCFEQHSEQVRGMFDEFFVRMLRIYPSGSIANFTTGNSNLHMTRDHLYYQGINGCSDPQQDFQLY